ncbi:MAG TPA: AI-2E family transporter [Casimicrobiaceae bacterium]|nr:AI-2E family transporter [Casimicrobiaceae bacterium]
MREAASAVREQGRRECAPAPDAAALWQTASHRRTGVRTAALVIIAVVVACVAIHLAAPFLIPLAVSLVICYALAPVVDRLERWHVMRPVGAALVVLLLLASGGAAVDQLWNGAEALLAQLPAAVEKIRLRIALTRSDVPDTLTHVQRTANELQKLAGTAAPAPASPSPQPAPPPAPTLDWRSILLMGTTSALGGAVQLASIVFLTYFLLAAGDLFRRKLVHLVGPPLARQKAALEVLNHIHELNQRYLAVVAFVNVGVGICTAVGLALLGLEHAAIWGVAIAVLHFIPYLGAAVIVGAVALAGYLQFGTAQMALIAAAIPLAASVLIGVLLQAALLGRAARMNATIVFIALLFWGTLWGAWGLLLAMPIMVAIKSICDRVEPLASIGQFLGDDERAVWR